MDNLGRLPWRLDTGQALLLKRVGALGMDDELPP